MSHQELLDDMYKEYKKGEYWIKDTKNINKAINKYRHKPKEHYELLRLITHKDQ